MKKFITNNILPFLDFIWSKSSILFCNSLKSTKRSIDLCLIKKFWIHQSRIPPYSVPNAKELLYLILVCNNNNTFHCPLNMRN